MFCLFCISKLPLQAAEKRSSSKLGRMLAALTPTQTNNKPSKSFIFVLNQLNIKMTCIFYENAYAKMQVN